MAIRCPKCRSENSEDKKYCADCGTQLRAFKDVQPEVTETIQNPPKELTTGSTIAGRYQIIEELGRGGMGTVYRVMDKKLKEEVALKLIRPEIASDKETIERFSNELKLARKIGHRNVGRMYELMEDEEAHFLTMEYVAGEDLRSFIRRSRQLTVGTAVFIAKQVGEGLAEAHRLGVVHRDLKPGNIMIDKDGNARIMDFGIARSLARKHITGAGVMIGTPEYMSPEQVEGKEADQRSDIYSLGIILFQMLTGRVPFEGDTPLSVAVKQKIESPRSPRTINPQVPEDLSRLILRCLEKEKEKRYQTAEEVIADLDRMEKGISTTERISPNRERLTSREIHVKFSLKKLFLPVLAFLALIAAGIIFWGVHPRKKLAPPTIVSAEPTLAVLYFENKSGDENLEFWRNAVPELLITDLSQSKYIRVVSGEEMLTILRRLGLAEAGEYSSEDIGRIADQTRASHVLRGSIIRAGENIIITASLKKPGTGDTMKTLRLEAHGENEIIAKVDELTHQVKEGFNLSASQIAGDIEKEVGKITTTSPQALKYYLEGRRLHDKRELELVITCMEKALEVDPEFAMAYRGMAVAYLNMGNQDKARKYNAKALELSGRLPDNERLLIEADKLKNDEDYAGAIKVYEELLRSYPGNLAGHNNLALAFTSVEDYDKAVELLEPLIKSWKKWPAVVNLADSYMAKGLYQKAEDVCRSFLQDVEDNSHVRWHLYTSYLCRRQYDLALAEAEKMETLNPSAKYRKGQVLLFQDDISGAEKILGSNALLLIHGQFGQFISLGEQMLERAKKNKRNEHWGHWRMAYVLDKAGRYDEALRAFNTYLELSSKMRKAEAASEQTRLPSEQKSDLFIKGRLQAETGSFDEARKTAEELRSLIRDGINRKEMRKYEYILGQIELGKRNPRQAVKFFEKACGRLDFENLGRESDHAMYFDGLARALYESDDLDKARKEYERITLLTIGRGGHGDIYARAHYMLGKIYGRQENKPKALENYQKFLDLWKDADPGLPEVKDARKRLAGLSRGIEPA